MTTASSKEVNTLTTMQFTTLMLMVPVTSWYYRECDVWIFHTGDAEHCFLIWHTLATTITSNCHYCMSRNRKTLTYTYCLIILYSSKTYVISSVSDFEKT